MTPVLMLPVKSLVQEPVPHGFGTHRFWVGDTVCKRHVGAYREKKTVPITRNDGKWALTISEWALSHTMLRLL